MKYGYGIMANGEITFHSGEHLVYLKELTKEQHDQYLSSMETKIIYLGQDGDLHMRDKGTIWDEKTQSWIIDQVSIEQKAKQDLIGKANGLINQYTKLTNPYYWNKLSPVQQVAFTEWFDELHKIVTEESSATELPNISPILDFIKA